MTDLADMPRTVKRSRCARGPRGERRYRRITPPGGSKRAQHPVAVGVEAVSTLSRTATSARRAHGAADTGEFVAGADVTELRERDMLAQREASKRPRVYEYVDECPMPVSPVSTGTPSAAAVS